MSATQSPAPPPTLADPGLFCPACGYDLRATPGDLCGECGLAVDRDALRHSGIPWAYRARMGATRAYLRTVWMVTLGSRKLALEAAKPQDARDARAFRRVTAALVAAVFLTGFFATIFAAGKGMALLAIPVPSVYALPPISQWRVWSPAWQDLIVPWFAGATLWPVLPASLLLLAFYLSGAPRTIFRLPATTEPPRRARARTLGLYAAAPLAWLIPGAAVVTAGGAVERYLVDHVQSPFHTISLALSISGWTAVASCFVMTIIRAAQWAARARHWGLPGAALLTAELAARWVAGVLVTLVALPWCAGFTWLVIDSLRP